MAAHPNVNARSWRASPRRLTSLIRAGALIDSTVQWDIPGADPDRLLEMRVVYDELIAARADLPAFLARVCEAEPRLRSMPRDSLEFARQTLSGFHLAASVNYANATWKAIILAIPDARSARQRERLGLPRVRTSLRFIDR